MMRQYELVERVKSYDPSADEDALNRAYVFSMQAHGTQLRESGDSYFSHPVEVAGILSDKKLDCDSIVTGLLHDTVEDTVATIEDIHRLFGPDVAKLVDGVTKLSQIELQSDQTKQAENFRKLLLAMSEDIRVLLVKLADRLHNMRTLHHLGKVERRRRIGRETMEIYAPLAERIGIRDWKDELEDLAFVELNLDGRLSIINRLDFLRNRGGDLVSHVMTELGGTLNGSGLEAAISGREKTPYAIWRKMQRKNIGFEQLSDIMAFRVVVGSVEQCYQALGVIHARYRMIPGRFKDFISIPKPNGYESLHSSVIGPENQRIEIQIRTSDMHEVAELGVAAHWSYKQGVQTDGKQYRWLRELLEILDHADAPEEFLEHTKLEMFSDQVFCFSPKGDLQALPSGATPIDFAYAVHTEIGNTCVGAKINGRIAPLRTELNNGDQVEILTSKTQNPSPVWEGFVATGKARACIRRYVRSQQRQEYIILGREIAEKAFRQSGHAFRIKSIKDSLKQFAMTDIDDLFFDVGRGQLSGFDVLSAVFPEMKSDARPSLAPTPSRNGDKVDHAIPIKGLIPGMALHYAGCCHPIPGDRIVGIVVTGKGVTIHTIDCETLENYTDTPERWLDVAWDLETGGIQVGRIRIMITNEPGSLANLTMVIGRNEGNISNLKVIDRSSDFFELLVDIEVTDVKQLNNIIAGLRATPEVNSVDRDHH
ncbi:MAG: bifunctional (p)ppGpp synthetase/guanosine-3',5'-bis(diphosphate) 3'-pyrophosphohydrolase [Alphaproteobacteria bacterium]|nr:bifunctional (p)ppGpp synthetase/guanosine-3',5'-bis(diphosphate) 3'-pyrophosphohydrolase [Alphaproteobacteria bacterium]